MTKVGTPKNGGIVYHIRDVMGNPRRWHAVAVSEDQLVLGTVLAGRLTAFAAEEVDKMEVVSRKGEVKRENGGAEWLHPSDL